MSVEDQSGLGVPPMSAQQHGQDAQATIKKRQGTYLPHWTRDGSTYAVTFRLADSLPRPVLEAWLFERRNIILTAEQIGRPLSEQEQQRLQKLHSERIEAYLDAGHGDCWLRQPVVAQIVADALRHFDTQRYRLHGWCIMPNHVHTIVEPHPGHELPDIRTVGNHSPPRLRTASSVKRVSFGRRNTMTTSSAMKGTTRTPSTTYWKTQSSPG